MVDALNPFSDNFILKTLLDYLNPFSDNFILKSVLEFLGNILSYLNPFSDNFILKGVLEFLGNILNYINPWSDKFFLKIATTLSEEQHIETTTWQEEFNNKFNNKLPFVNSIVDIFQNVKTRQANVRNTRTFENNPLNLSIGSFSYDGGAISYNTPSTDLSFFLEKYEPYRVQIRDGLKMIIYGLGAVYLVKYILNYGVTESGNLGISIISASKKGGEK